MKKIKFLIVTICILLIGVLTSCTGYNSVMIEHLSNKDNYHTYFVTVEGVSSFDDTSEMICLDVIFSAKEDVAKFKGTLLENLTYEPNEYIITVVINGENVRKIYNTEFNQNVNVGDEISITVSNFIYMDGNFFYVIGLEKDGQVYLESTIGLENVINLMNGNKSLL